MCGDINRKKTDSIDNDKKYSDVKLNNSQKKNEEKKEEDELFNSTFKIVYSKKNSGFTSFLKDKTINEKDKNNDSFFYSFKTDVFEDWYDGLLDVINSYNKNNSRKRNPEHNGSSKTTKHTKTKKINIWKPIFKHKYDKQAGNLRINIWTIVVPFILSILMGGGLFFSLYDENLTTRIISGVLLLISSFTLFFSLWILAWKRYNFKKSLSSALNDIFKISRNIKNDKDKKVVICFDNFNEELLDNNLLKDFINNVIELFNKNKNEDLKLNFFFVANNDKLFDNNNLVNKTKNFLQELIHEKQNKNILISEFNYSGAIREAHLKKLYLSKLFKLLSKYNNHFFESIVIKNVITSKDNAEEIFEDYLFSTMNFLYLGSAKKLANEKENNYDLESLLKNNLKSSIFKLIFQPYSYIFDKAVNWFSPSEMDSLITELELMFKYINDNNFIEYINPIQVFLVAAIKLFIPDLYNEINYFNDYILFKNNIFSELKFDLTKDFDHEINKSFFSNDSKYFKISNLILENKEMLHNLGAFDYLFANIRINEKQWVLSEYWYTNFIDISNYYYILVNDFKFEDKDLSKIKNHRDELLVCSKEDNKITNSIKDTRKILNNNTFNIIFENASLDLVLYHDLFLKSDSAKGVKEAYIKNYIVKVMWLKLIDLINKPSEEKLFNNYEELNEIIELYKNNKFYEKLNKIKQHKSSESNPDENILKQIYKMSEFKSFFKFEDYKKDINVILSLLNQNVANDLSNIENEIWEKLNEKFNLLNSGNINQMKLLSLIFYIKVDIFTKLKTINKNLSKDSIGYKNDDDKILADDNKERFTSSLKELVSNFKNNYINFKNINSWFDSELKIFNKAFFDNRKLLHVDDVYSLMWNYPNNKILRTQYDSYYSKMFVSIINNIFYGLWDLNSTWSIDKTKVFEEKLFHVNENSEKNYEYYQLKYSYIYFLLLTMHSFEYIYKTFKLISLLQKDSNELTFFDIKIDKKNLENKEQTYSYLKQTLVEQLSNVSKQLVDDSNINYLLIQDVETNNEDQTFSLFSSKNRLLYDWLLRNKVYLDKLEKTISKFKKHSNYEYNISFNIFVSNLIIDADLSTSLIIDAKLMLNSKNQNEIIEKKIFIDKLLLRTFVKTYKENNKTMISFTESNEISQDENTNGTKMGKLVSDTLIKEHNEKSIKDLSFILTRNDKEKVHFYTFDDFFLSKTNLFEDDLTFTYTFNHKSGLNYLDYVYPYIFDKSKKEDDK